MFLTRPRNSVYIMQSAAHPGKIKIGVSNAPEIRATQVGRKGKGKQPHRVEVAFQTRMPNAYAVEALFHRIYRPLNAPTSGDGRTEWFTCFPLIVAALLFYSGWFMLYRERETAQIEIAAHLFGIVTGCYFAFIFVTAAALLLVRIVLELLPMAVLAAVLYFFN